MRTNPVGSLARAENRPRSPLLRNKATLHPNRLWMPPSTSVKALLLCASGVAWGEIFFVSIADSGRNRSPISSILLLETESKAWSLSASCPFLVANSQEIMLAQLSTMICNKREAPGSIICRLCCPTTAITLRTGQPRTTRSTSSIMGFSN